MKHPFSSFLVLCVTITVSLSFVQATSASSLRRPEKDTQTEGHDTVSTSTTSTTVLLSNSVVGDGAPSSSSSSSRPGRPLVHLPLVGYGVGNLPHELIVANVAQALTKAYQYRLIDTAHASHNEHLIAMGISNAMANDDNYPREDDDDEIHIITKVWYTYLGYERTKISVKESLEEIKHHLTTTTTNMRQIKVHVLLHWPRCRHDIPWMNCEQEEDALPQNVKDAGPAPHLDKDHAFLESWRALEDYYLSISSNEHDATSTTNSEHDGFVSVSVASIGVSNFDRNDFQALSTMSRITPQILQTNVWTIFFDPYLVQYCQDHHIHIQVYNVMNGIMSPSSTERAPNAYHSLQSIAYTLTKTTMATTTNRASSTALVSYGPSHVVLKWFVQQNISVIPRTVHHMPDNAPTIIHSIPTLTEKDMASIRQAIEALLTGHDLHPPIVAFVNHHIVDNNNNENNNNENSNQDKVFHLYWWNHEEEKEIPVKLNMKPGERFETNTYTGHRFVAYEETKSSTTSSSSSADEEQGDEPDHAKNAIIRREFTIGATYGEREEIRIDEL